MTKPTQQTILHHSPKFRHLIIKYPDSPRSKSQTYYYKKSSLLRLSNIEFKTRLIKAITKNPYILANIITLLSYYADPKRDQQKIAIVNRLIECFSLAENNNEV